jgi:hypothetical protein
MKPASQFLLAMVLPLFLAAPALAEPILPDEAARLLERDFPRGTVDAEHSNAALRQAGRAHEAVLRRYEADRRACAGDLLVNHCLEVARHRRNEGERVVHRVELDAHDAQRAHAAAERARRQAQDRAQEPDREAQRREKERNAEAAAKDRRREPASPPPPKAGVRATPPATAAEQEQKRERDSAQRAAQAVVDANLKKTQAARYAAQRATEAGENRKRREEREASRSNAAAAADGAVDGLPPLPPSAAPR